MLNSKKIKLINKSLLWRGLGGFLLFIFLFPQVNNALHYFVIEHHFHQYNKYEKQFVHNDKTHDCEQSIFKIPSVLLFDFGYKKSNTIIQFYSIEKPLYNVLYNKNFFENLSDRGPPFWINYLSILSFWTKFRISINRFLILRNDIVLKKIYFQKIKLKTNEKT